MRSWKDPYLGADENPQLPENRLYCLKTWDTSHESCQAHQVWQDAALRRGAGANEQLSTVLGTDATAGSSNDPPRPAKPRNKPDPRIAAWKRVAKAAEVWCEKHSQHQALEGMVSKMRGLVDQAAGLTADLDQQAQIVEQMTESLAKVGVRLPKTRAK